MVLTAQCFSRAELYRLGVKADVHISDCRNLIGSPRRVRHTEPHRRCREVLASKSGCRIAVDRPLTPKRVDLSLLAF
jgi:hypothetical protein